MKKSVRFSILIFLTTFFSFSISAQEFHGEGEHMYEEMLFGSRQKEVPSRYDVNGAGIIPLQNLKNTKGLSKIVFGFMPDWEYTNDANADMHYDLLTHVAAFAFYTNSGGNISYPNAWPWTDVINAAHSHGTKVIMAVTNFKGGATEKPSAVAHNLLTSTSARDVLFNNIKKTITTYKLDGVNIDFEAMNSADRGDLLNKFMSALTNFIHTNLPGKEVSFDGPAVNWSGWNIDGLAQSVDYIFIMGYDYSGSWSKNTGAVAPLTGSGHCIQYDLTHTYGAPLSKYPQKLVLGVPYYGKHWKTSTGNAGSSVTSFVGSTFYRSAVTDAANHGGFIWDNTSQTPWYKWESGGWNQVWNDNAQSLGKKYDYALTENIGGIGIWALNYDGSRTELWDLINTKFGGGSTPIPSRPKSPAVLCKNDTTLTIEFRPGNYADSYRIYESTDNVNYTLVKETGDTITDVSGLKTDSVYYFKMTSVNDAGESAKTHVLAASPGKMNKKFLIVDGVERRSYPAIIQYKYPMTQLGYTFSSTSNEAIMDGLVDMKNYKFIIWMLLDESTADDTFNKTEQAKVKDFIDNGEGVFIVSGSEVGWDLVEKGDATDKAFYETYFRAQYISDAPGTGYTKYTAEDNNHKIYHFDDGTHGITKIGYPDLIKPLNGSTESFTYPGVDASSGIAGVVYKTATGGMAYLAFPIEAVYKESERKDLLAYVFQDFSGFLSVKKNLIRNHIRLYPNPTNGIIRISHPETIKIHKVVVFDMFGRKVMAAQDVRQIDLGSFPKGLYIVKIEDTKGETGSFKVIKR